MAAYAAILSLKNTINLEQIPHPTRSLNSAVTQLMQSISERATFLQEFLEDEWKESEHLEGRITDAAYAAEDAIESNIVDQVLSRSTSQADEESNLFYQLQKVLQEMDLIKIKAMQIKESGRIKDHGLLKSSTSAASLQSPFDEKNKMVGFEDEKKRIMEELAGYQKNRQVIPIVGMGGAGKTTLARNVYDDKFVNQYFHVRAWVTVSQEYVVSEIFRGVLSSLGKQGADGNSIESSNTIGDETLGEQVHKTLSGRRYLIVLDDIWSIECWCIVSRYFPDNNNGGRVVVTTRLSNVAKQISSISLDMKLLGMDESWNLFCKTVFAQENCPFELEEVGKKIAQNCGGLPLALVVIGGLLKKSNMTVEYWNKVADDVNSTLTLDANALCLDILSLSYNYLPIYLKPCFLYMSIFPEDSKIHVSKLSKLWIAEGFLKPCRGKSSEEIAEKFLEELVERNLILVSKLRSSGKIKFCKIHDLLRDLSLRKAQEEKFICVIGAPNLDVPLVMRSQRRVVVNQCILGKNEHGNLFHSLQPVPLARSLVCSFDQVLSAHTSRLLRLLHVDDSYSSEETHEYDKRSMEVAFQLVNSRYLSFLLTGSLTFNFSFSISRMRNIQTIVVRAASDDPIIAPSEIWDMLQLRHINFTRVILPHPTFDQNNSIVLENLHTLKGVVNFQCSEDILLKVSNVRNLYIRLERSLVGYEVFHYLQNLKCFQKLKSLFLLSDYPIRNMIILNNIGFPHSLTKLTLNGCELFWEDMTMIGSLPVLEVLELKHSAFKGSDWNPIQGEFLCLKFLLVYNCSDLVNWNADSSHFPRLEKLIFEDLSNLNEIPLDVGEIQTLSLIHLIGCSKSSNLSAVEILEEQESLGNSCLQVRVEGMHNDWMDFEYSSDNFHKILLPRPQCCIQ